MEMSGPLFCIGRPAEPLGSEHSSLTQALSVARFMAGRVPDAQEAYVSIFTLKSILAVLMLGLAGYGMYTMMTVFGRDAANLPVDRLKRRHKAAGYLYIALVLFVSYLCIGFAAASRAEMTPRAALHALLALTIIALFPLKVLFVRVFPRFYGHARTVGIVIGVTSFVLAGLSGGYFLAVSRCGQDRTIDRSVHYALRGPLLMVEQTGRPEITAIRTDRQSIERGRGLFGSRCAACHDPHSTRTIVGPGLQGLLRQPKLPVSGHPATAESIRFQLRQPLRGMPSFSYLSDDEMNDLIAYLNTL
jgi:mono/diheme cytochrome c family protein